MDAESEINLRKIELIDFELPSLEQGMKDVTFTGMSLIAAGGAAIWSGNAAGDQWDGFGTILETTGYIAGGGFVAIGSLAIMSCSADALRYVKRKRELRRLD